MTNIYDLDTPALLADLDRVEQNVQEMALLAREGGKALRPHAKTHKTPEIARIQIEAGSTGITVAKLGEAEVMAAAGIQDIFIANQIVGPQKIARLIRLATIAIISIAVDSLDVAEPIDDAARAAGLRIPVLIEVDTGNARAGTRSAEELLRIARAVTFCKGLELRGIYTHEGQLYRLLSAEERAEQSHAIATHMRALADLMTEQGTPPEVISVGSTPGAALLAAEERITEMRPGVYLFNDRMQIQLGVPLERCALTVMATVTSVRSDGKIIIDAGTKSMAGDIFPKDRTFGLVLGHPELQFVGASEEHGHLLAGSATNLRVGRKVRIVPNHACTCVNMHDKIVVHRGEQIEAIWPIAARGKIN